MRTLLLLLMLFLTPAPEVHTTTVSKWLEDGPRLVKQGVRLVAFSDAYPDRLFGTDTYYWLSSYMVELNPMCRYHIKWELYVHLNGFVAHTAETGQLFDKKEYKTPEEAVFALECAAIDYARYVNRKKEKARADREAGR